jgi:Flp pilus assembly protein TadD
LWDVLWLCADARGALLCYEALAELQVFLGERGAARATIAAAMRSRQPNARFLRVAGLIEKRLGDLDAAAALMKRSVAVDPRDYKSWLAVRTWLCCFLPIRMNVMCC